MIKEKIIFILFKFGGFGIGEAVDYANEFPNQAEMLAQKIKVELSKKIKTNDNDNKNSLQA